MNSISLNDYSNNSSLIWDILFHTSKPVSSCQLIKFTFAFKDGRESITDDLRSGRPVDVSTPEAVQAVEDLIKSDVDCCIEWLCYTISFFVAAMFL